MKEILVLITEFIITLLMCVGGCYFFVKKEKQKEEWGIFIFCICLLFTHIFIYLYFDLCFIVKFLSSSEMNIGGLIFICLLSLLCIFIGYMEFFNEIKSKKQDIKQHKEQNQQNFVDMFENVLNADNKSGMSKTIENFAKRQRINQIQFDLDKFLIEKNKNEIVPKSIFWLLLHEINSSYFQDEAVEIEIERIDKSELDYFKNYETHSFGGVIDYRFLGKEQKIIIREFLIELYNLYLPESSWVEKSKVEREEELIRKEEEKKEQNQQNFVDMFREINKSDNVQNANNNSTKTESETPKTLEDMVASLCGFSFSPSALRKKEERKRENVKTYLNIHTRSSVTVPNMMPMKCVFCQGRGYKTYTNMFNEIESSPCPDCFGTGYAHGTGGFSSSDGNMMPMKCFICQGTGFRTYTNMFDEIESSPCPDCFGTGYLH